MFISASHAQAELTNLVDQPGFDESDSDPKKADFARIVTNCLVGRWANYMQTPHPNLTVPYVLYW